MATSIAPDAADITLNDDKMSDAASSKSHECRLPQQDHTASPDAIHVTRSKDQRDIEKNTAPKDEIDSDPNLVAWEGPNDPANPKNWPNSRRWLATGLVSLTAFVTPITSSMIAPAESAIGNDLNVHGQFQLALIFSIFLLAFVVGPFVLAPACEIYGRVVVLQLANVFFLVFNLACGFAQNDAQMLAFRFLSGLGACAPQTIGGGVISDLWTSEERGKAVALYALTPVMGPSLGPLIGAWITQRTTWRWSFWSVTIFGVAVLVLIFFTLSETYGPTILHWKAKKLRKETGNMQLHTRYELSGDETLGTKLRTASVRVVILLFTQPIIIFLASYMALMYGITYIMLSTFPDVWTGIYGETIGIGGLNYLSILIGFLLGMQIGGPSVDILYRRLKKRYPAPDLTSENPNPDAGRPEFRVPVLFISTPLSAAGLFLYGWSAQYRTHWIVPNIGAALIMTGTGITMTGLQTYTMDAYPLYAASAIGATAVARSLTGFGLPLFAPEMYARLGWGAGNSLLAGVTLLVGGTGSTVLWFYGHRLRAASQYATDKNA